MSAKPSQAQLEAKAKEAIELQKEITQKGAVLDGLKQFFRDYVLKHNGKALLRVPVTGLGVVSVAAPSAAKEATTQVVPEKVIFHEDKFRAATQKNRQALVNLGIVEIIPAGTSPVAAKPEGTPAVTVTVT